MTLLGSLATAGMSALAYEHEIGKQFHILESVARELSSLRVSDTALRQRLQSVAQNVNEWLERARATRTLFSPLMDEENRTLRDRFKAKVLIEQVKEQVSGLTRGVGIDTEGIDKDLRLPEGSFAEWSSIFQNVFLNAVNATLDSKQKLIAVSSTKHGQRRAILLQDTGKGVDLKKADNLFEPFVRELEISLERRALELGGTGLGLTIVRMLAHGLNCKARFIEPEKPFKTAFEISWSEKK
jgi:signal transduction histidine kinase